MRIRIVLALFISILFPAVATCAVPSADLPIATPESQGLDSLKLVELCDHLNQSDLDVRSFLILRNGNLVFERYEQKLTPDHNFYVYSVTKSITSTLIGIAIDRKFIDSVEKRITSFFADVRVRDADARRAKITIQNLLTMSSGIKWKDTAKTPLDPGTDLADMVAAADRVAFVLNRPMVGEPGSIFNYSNGDAQLLAGILARTTRAPVPTFARSFLFDKLGFRGWEWVWPDKTGLVPGGYALRLRARDMAKFGQLFLQKGMWNGERIVSADWVRDAIADHTKHAYGYMWWSNIKAGNHPTFAAIGFRGQFVCVIPDLKMVIVMTADIDPGTMTDAFAKIVSEHVLPAVKSDTAIDANPQAVRALDESFRRAFLIERKHAKLSEDDTPRVSTTR